MYDVKYALIDNVLIENPTPEQLKKEDVTIIVGGEENIVIQQWYIDSTKQEVIDFAFSTSELLSFRIFFRKKYFIRNGIKHTPQYMRKITIPKSCIFDDGIKGLEYFMF